MTRWHQPWWVVAVAANTARTSAARKEYRRRHRAERAAFRRQMNHGRWRLRLHD